MKSEIFCKIGRAFGKTKLYLRAKSPEILIGVGIASGIACAAMAIVETHKYADDILKSHKEAVDKVKETEEKYPEEYSKKDATVDLIIAHKNLVVDVVKVYWPSIALGAVSIVSTLGAYKIINGRYVAALATSTALKEAFEKYRKRVVDEYGEEMDNHFMYGTKKQTFVEKDKDGNDIVTTAEVPDDENLVLPDNIFIFARGESSEWANDSTYDVSFLNLKQSLFNTQLRASGFVLLNDILYDLGIKKTSAGARLGWIWDKAYYPDGVDPYIDFGIKELKDEYGRPIFVLEFNCLGEVDRLIDKVNKNNRQSTINLPPFKPFK